MNQRKNKLNWIFVYIEKYYFVFLIIIFIVAFFNIFYNLGRSPIFSWDEARHGVSAYEMQKNKDLIINTYGYEKDYWNLKPPLSFWAIVLGYKLAGFNALGLRLISAVAAIITIVSIAFFTKYKHGKLASLIAATMLTTTTQYILSHSARTGDADSLHVMFFTLAAISIALLGNNIIWLYSSGFFFSLSFLTKSWHALNILVIIGVYLIISKVFLKIKLKEWILFALASSTPILIWGLLRYSKDGLTFFKMMINFDLMARTSSTLEGHIGGPSYYLLTLQYSSAYWILLLIVGLIILLFIHRESPAESERNYILLLIVWITIPLLFYSFSKTKITWYILPVYPALSVCTGAVLAKILGSPKMWTVLKVVIAFSITSTMYFNENRILKSITPIQTSDMQLTLQNINKLKTLGYENIYTICGPEGYSTCWLQCDLLAAELYSDLKAKGGGFQSFEQDIVKSLIVIPKKNTELSTDKKYRLIYEDDFFGVLRKK